MVISRKALFLTQKSSTIRVPQTPSHVSEAKVQNLGLLSETAHCQIDIRDEISVDNFSGDGCA